jgi:hypothetical protein
MLSQRLLIPLVFLTLSSGAFASNRDCNEIKNDRARDLCFEQSRKNNNNRMNCNELSNQRARDKCWDRQRDDNNNRNCNDFKNERARERCWNESNNSNNNWNRPNRPSSSGGRTFSEAQQFCASAGRADDHAACMEGQGFSSRR